MLLNIGNDRKISEIPIVQIRPCKTQARKNFDCEKLQELAESIKRNGILQPVTVRKINSSEYELISGERRLRAAAMCGKKYIPCLVLRCSESQALLYSLIENSEKSDLNFFEEAEGIYRLINMYGLSYREAAERLGKRPSAVENKLRLLHICKDDRDIIIKYHLSEYHARALLKVEDKTERRMILSEIIQKNMNPAQSEKYIDNLINSKNLPKQKTQKNKYVIKNIKIFENTIEKAIECMLDSGIAAECNFSDSKEYIEYTIKIPKQQIVSKKSKNEMTA